MNKRECNTPRFAHIVLSVVFILMIFLSGVAAFVFQRNTSEVENRVLATFPKPNVSDIMSCNWQRKVEEFASDQMPFRDSLSSLYKCVKFALGSRELDGVLVGTSEDGEIRLFEALKYDIKRTQRLTATLDAINRFASVMDSDVVVMAIPSSSLVYSEDMPSHAGTDEIEELYALATKEKENYSVISILQALLDEKATGSESLYFRTDHHWTSRGAYAAYCYYCECMGMSPVMTDYEIMSEDFYGSLQSKALLPFIVPDTLERCTNDVSDVRVSIGGGYGEISDLSQTSLFHGGFLSKKDKYAYFLGGNYGLTLIENDALSADAPTLLLFKDSFANAFAPYLSANYRRIIMIDPRYYRGSTGNLISLIESESPSTIIFLYEIATISDDTSLRQLLERMLD